MSAYRGGPDCLGRGSKKKKKSALTQLGQRGRWAECQGFRETQVFGIAVYSRPCENGLELAMGRGKKYGQAKSAKPGVRHLRHRSHDYDTQSRQHVLVDCGSDDAGEGRVPIAEDIKKTALNPDPDPKQLEPNERVERIRRIQLNDLENLPYFLIAGLLFVLTEPSLLLARWLLYGYAVSRLLHFAAYFTERTHDTRATLWTAGSLILIFMTGRTLVAAFGY